MNVNEVTKLSKTPFKCIVTCEKFEFYEYPYYKARKQRSLVPQKENGLDCSIHIKRLFQSYVIMLVVSMHSTSSKKKVVEYSFSVNLDLLVLNAMLCML